MKKVEKKSNKQTVLHLRCIECGNKFTSRRYKKYCNWNCQRTANARFSKIRYDEMRRVVLKAKGVIE